MNIEPTEEQVKEYCRKRCLIVVSNELFNKMKNEIDSQRVEIRHGHWIGHEYYECSVCGAKHDMDWYYCPTCGAKMDGVKE